MRYEYLDVPDIFKTNNVEKVRTINIIVKANLDKLDQIKITPSKIVGLIVSMNTFFLVLRINYNKLLHVLKIRFVKVKTSALYKRLKSVHYQ